MQQDPKAAEQAGGPLLLTDRQAAHLLGVGKTTFHALRSQPWFPKCIALGPRMARWSRAEIEAAIEAMPREGARPEPFQLLKGRVARAKETGIAV